jgi:GNAT superfamily N-acetyltransferase
MRDLDIRPCAAADVAALEAAMPSGLDRRHEQRFRRQECELGTYLVAWLDGVPVGKGEIRWDGCAAPEVARLFPGCPEVNGLDVWPPEQRSRGIGTAILQTAEGLAVARGLERVGLGVTDDNVRAARLYLRLGYTETGCRYVDRYVYTLPGGKQVTAADQARFLVKPLRATPR